MPTIEFVRVERDCPANKDARKQAAKDGTSPRLIYDFDVMVDGERRAELRRVYTGKGYTVQDADGRPVDPLHQGRRDGREVPSKLAFMPIISELLDAGKIPTLAQMAELRAAEAQALAVKIAEKKAKQVLNAKVEFAAEMYDALKLALAALSSTAGKEDRIKANIAVSGVLDATDASAAASSAAVDEDPGRFGIH